MALPQPAMALPDPASTANGQLSPCCSLPCSIEHQPHLASCPSAHRSRCGPHCPAGQTPRQRTPPPYPGCTSCRPACSAAPETERSPGGTCSQGRHATCRNCWAICHKQTRLVLFVPQQCAGQGSLQAGILVRAAHPSSTLLLGTSVYPPHSAAREACNIRLLCCCALSSNTTLLGALLPVIWARRGATPGVMVSAA